jgi:N-acetylglucosaminyldiphosphoundecaprenol N-acetyl-beta-D-mannosaminyltransferase
LQKAKKSSKINLKRSATSVKKLDNSIKIFDIVINGTRKDRVLRTIWLQRKKMLHVATLNPEYIMEARRNARFKSILARCLTVADGHGVVWSVRLASFAQDNSIDRISGIELVEEILKHASQKGEKVFLLGAGEGVAEKAAAQMSKKYPGLQMSSYSGAKSVVVEEDEEASMTIAKINSICPDYLLVAYGSPWQDIWIEENRPYLRVRVAMGVGGVLDDWAGVVKACPEWIDLLGLKWAWRVMHEPRRWRRILKVWQFGVLVLYHKLID